MYTVLNGAAIFDSKGDWIEDGVMIFKDENIYYVGTKNDLPIPEDSKTLDLKGKFIIPGLIDTHVHLDMHGMGDTVHESLVEDKLRAIRAAREMNNTVLSGVTTVRNCGSSNFIDIAVKKAVEEKLISGPRILSSGRIICMVTAGSEYFKGLYREADGVDENRRAAREQLKEGADCLKVMATGAIMNPGGEPGSPQLDEDEIRAVVKEGKKVGKHTAAHAHGSEGIINAVNAGVRTIEHGTLANEKALKLMADKGIFLTSTLSSNFWMLSAKGQNGIPQFMFEKARDISKIRQENLVRAIDAGVRVVMGTDAGTPYNYHGKNAMEIIQYVKLGIMNEKDALFASTRIAADAVGMADRIGTLEKGKSADCIVLDKDPLKDIQCLEAPGSIVFVFKKGELIRGKVDASHWVDCSHLKTV
ncbi:MAG: amidohydrolase family protein [Thermodesulfobacteriota bacterium]|nr:amidohydrolase family protein [Thermodesulfobacteriota bacterium]